MKKKIIFIVLSIPVILGITSVTIRCVNIYCSNANANRLYQDGLKLVYDKNNQFSPQAELDFYDSLLKLPFPQEKLMGILACKSISLMKMGREKEAIAIMEPILDTWQNKTDQMAVTLREDLALSYLRLGERNNCIKGHSSGSCIFPIQGKGIYSDPSATQKGIQLYENMLGKDSTDLVSRWLLNIAYMTIGEYPSRVPPRWLIPGLDTDTTSYKVKPFTDMAGDLQLTGPGNMAGGTIIDDMNNDGYLDIITSSWGLNEPMHYYRNNQDGTFTDISESSGLSKIKGGLNIMQADYNNDGLTDILVLRGAWLGESGKQPNTLLKNNGDGTFTDVTVESGILSFHPTQTASWADYNNDGWLDLFIGNETTNQWDPNPAELYINNQDGTFTNVASEAGINICHFTKGVTTADYNNDGWPDIFISNFDGKKMLLKNKGVKSKIPQFVDVAHEAGLDKDPTQTSPTWFWDYNNDGWPDIFVCGYENRKPLSAVMAAEALGHPFPRASKMFLYRNNHDGTFTDVAKEAGLQRSVFGMGSNFGDIDNDGWPDMYIGTGNPDFKSLIPNRMFKNIDGEKFVDVTNSARVGHLQKGHGVAFADVDNDGDQDIYVKIGGALVGDSYFNSFFINPGQNQNHWISVLLQGVKSNRSAIGAHIAVSFTENGSKRTVYMDVNSGGSFGANPFRKEIGIGKATHIDELIVKWPTSGIVQVFKNLEPNQFITIKEGNNEIAKNDLKRLTFKPSQNYMQMIPCGPVK